MLIHKLAAWTVSLRTAAQSVTSILTSSLACAANRGTTSVVVVVVALLDQ